MSVTELTIRELGPKGDGIHLGSRGRVYVERTIPGDTIRAKVYKDAFGITRADVLDLLQSSQHRVVPPCKHFNHCGNCTLQHLKPDYYRYWKTEMVKEALRSQGLKPRRLFPTVFLGEENRRRATFSVQKVGQRLVMGYYKRRSREIIDIDSCSVASPKLLELKEAIKPFLARIIEPGTTTDVFIQLVGEGADLALIGPVGRQGQPDKFVRDVVQELLKVTLVSRVSWRPFEKEVFEQLGKKNPVIAAFGKLQVELPPAAFMQPTQEGENALVQTVVGLLPKKTNAKFADLFSGCGTFAGSMLTLGSVDAFETSLPAVQALGKAALKTNLKSFRRDLFRNPIRREDLNRYDAVVFDPPRGGCEEQVQQMASSRVANVIGVSCNPATFARDARILCDGGYRIESLQVVDQFKWSHHVEIVALFTKPKRGGRR